MTFFLLIKKHFLLRLWFSSRRLKWRLRCRTPCWLVEKLKSRAKIAGTKPKKRDGQKMLCLAWITNKNILLLKFVSNSVWSKSSYQSQGKMLTFVFPWDHPFFISRDRCRKQKRKSISSCLRGMQFWVWEKKKVYCFNEILGNLQRISPRINGYTVTLHIVSETVSKWPIKVRLSLSFLLEHCFRSPPFLVSSLSNTSNTLRY